MACFHPRTVWRSKRFVSRKSGKPLLRFKRPSLWFDESWKDIKGRTPKDFYAPEELQIPACKPKCVGCIEDYSRCWAVRAWHESQRHDLNCFITLTFSDSFLPSGGGLDHRHFQLFLKRLRRYLSGGSASSQRIRFFMAGEYGEKFGRPHYHACIFGYDFPDRKLWTVRGDVKLYTSEILSGLWSDPKTKESYGFCTVGDVTFESAAYIARYCAKKVSGVDAEKHYQGRKPEYVRMSLKPGIGKDWFLNYKDSVVWDDAVTLRDGSRCKIPRYYDKCYELQNPEHFAKIKSMRKIRASNSPDNVPARLLARESVKKSTT